MGAPGWTSFCRNGHIVQTCGHGEIAMNEDEKCGLCGEEVVGSVTEWGDEDYGPPAVPCEPIGADEIILVRKSKYGEKTDTFKAKIYDVSRLVRFADK